MSIYNPYVAPQLQPSQLPGQGWGNQERYVPLGWRTMLAAVSIASAAFFGLALDGAQVALGDKLKGETPDVVAAVVVFLVAMAFLGSLIAGAVFFGIWIHRAAKNLRGLGRTGMRFSPGWCVGSFYVPFVNLVRPVQAVSELWRASDADASADGYGWSGGLSQSTALIPVWWGTWLVGNIIANISGRIDDPSMSGSVGLLGSGLLVVAAGSCIVVIRGVSTMQARIAERMGPPAGFIG